MPDSKICNFVVIPMFNEECRFDKSYFDEFLLNLPTSHFYFVDDESTDLTPLDLAEYVSNKDRISILR